jgi:hypothetical protein
MFVGDSDDLNKRNNIFAVRILNITHAQFNGYRRRDTGLIIRNKASREKPNKDVSLY